jgi:ubiquinone/menaquinone biosynthesis C-methylase UbiE
MSRLEERVSAVRQYWEAHTLGKQYVTDHSIEVGSPEYFEHIRPWMNPYKFDWIMDRIEREAVNLRGKHLLEIGCGMGYDSLEFLKRGVRVTAIDLTESAVALTRRHFEVAGVESEDAEVRRVLKPGGRAMISHFYRKPSWMDLMHRYGRENIEHKDEDPPVNDFLYEDEITSFFEGFKIVEQEREHYRVLPVCRSGWKAALYHYVFKPVYNLMPAAIAKRWAYKYSVTAVKV